MAKSTVHQLKVTISGVRPPIWRRLVVPSTITLADLHQVIQAAFGWWDCHLHEFEFADQRYGVPDDSDWGPPVRSERSARLDRIAPSGTKFTYTYDFGDSWEHAVVVEQVDAADPDASYPSCIGGRRAGPPEDCGGVWGYAELLDILADPGHPERAERIEWLGSEFDPEAFDPADLADWMAGRR